MKKISLRLTAVVSAISLLGSWVPLVSAADQSTCFQKITEEMVTVHDEWRSRLFGSRKDNDDKIIALTGGQTDEERTGIFETKGRLTSELIEPIVESYRVYRCRTLAVCQVATASFSNSNTEAFDLKILGCATQKVKRYNECYFAGTPGTSAGTSDGDAKLQSEATGIVRNCQQLVDETLEGERAVLRLAVAYDSGYRALLQLAGMVDWMLQGFPTEVVKAISVMVNMLGKLHQIPCFIGQCDNPNTDDLTP